MKNQNEVFAQVELITPEIAKEYLKFNKVNRRLTNNVVEYYAIQMASKKWKLNGEPIIFLKNGALGNGQHRLNAIIKSGCSIQMLVVRGADNDSFTTYDSGKNRSIADIFSISGIENYSKVSSIVNRYFILRDTKRSIFDRANGLKLLRFNNHTIHTKDELLIEYNTSPELYQEVANLARTWNYRLKSYSTAALGAICIYLIKSRKHNKELVFSFFNQLFIGDDFSNHTIFLLRQRLIQDLNNRDRMTNRYKEQILVKAWNCFITGKELKSLRWSETQDGFLDFI